MMRRALVLLPLLAAGGCASTATRFWTIEPVAATAPVAATRGVAPIQVAAVHVPLAIDRLEVVQHDEADRVTVLDFDRWSAPPGDLLRRALTQDLAGLLPAGSVVYPEALASAGTRRLVVEVLDLRQAGDRYTMQVGWSVLARPAQSRQLTLTATVAGGGVAAQTRALADISGQLARDVATELSK